MSQWGQINVRIHRKSTNARIWAVLSKGSDSIVTEGYRMTRLIMEFTDAASVAPGFCLEGEPLAECSISLFDLLVEKKPCSQVFHDIICGTAACPDVDPT
jgi:hypothetical protein